MPTATVDLLLPEQAATASLAASIAPLLRRGDAILLEGPLGAGKSTFVRSLIRSACGDRALDVPSPTFTLVQSYEAPAGFIHHFDLWRLDGPSALTELGWNEACEDIVVVEWPDRLGEMRPSDALCLAFRPVPDDEGARAVAISGWPDRMGSLTHRMKVSAQV